MARKAGSKGGTEERGREGEKEVGRQKEGGRERLRARVEGGRASDI